MALRPEGDLESVGIVLRGNMIRAFEGFEGLQELIT